MAAREPDPVTDPLCDADPLARALAKLRPVQTGLDGQRLVYLAGQAERDRSVAFWRRVSIAQLAALVVAGGLYLMTTSLNDTHMRGSVEGGSTPGPHHAVPPSEVAPPPRPATPEAYYGIPQGFARAEPDDLSSEDRARWLALRNDVLTAGLGLLPNSRRPDQPAWDPVYGDPHVLANQRRLEPQSPPRNPPED